MGVIEERLAPHRAALAIAHSRGDRQAIIIAARAVAAAKAEELANIAPASMRRGDVVMTFDIRPRVITRHGVPVLDMTVIVHRRGQRLPVDGHLQFVNPPILVPDGNGGFVEDGVAALEAIVVQALSRQVRELR